MYKVNQDDIFTNTYGTFKVINYVNSRNVLIEWQDDHKHQSWTTASNILAGHNKNPYSRTAYGVGYMGVGDFVCGRNGKITPECRSWRSMMERCYTGRNPAYSNVSVCDKWHNFQNFAEWYSLQEFKGKGFALDKDIKFPGNKIYSPETCCLVPKRINDLFINTAVTSRDLPTGVIYSGIDHKPFTASCGSFIGNFETIEEAKNAYIKVKSETISKVADKHRDQLSKDLYDLLMNYPLSFDL